MSMRSYGRMGAMSFGDSATPAAANGRTDLAVRVNDIGEVTVVSVAGDLDMMTTPKLQQAVIKALDKAPRVLLLDLDEVTFLGSDGIAVLLRCHQYAGERISFRVVVTNPVSLRPMELTGITDVIRLFPTREEALGADD